MRTDEQLMENYAGGDRSAFDELYVRFEPRIRRIVQRHVYRASEVDDVVQQTFMQLHTSCQRFRAGEKLRPWLSTLALNQCRDYGRRQMRRPESALDVEALGVDPPALLPGEEQEDFAPLMQALESLSEVTQQIFRAHFVQERALVEIARELGANPSTIRVRLHRGCRELRATLAS